MAVILFVEDDASSRRSIVRCLRLAGYDVYDVEDGEAAARLLRDVQFDLVISDLNLPGQLTGLDVLDTSKRMSHITNAILITGAGSEEIKRRANSLGALYIEKPIALDELEQRVHQTVRQR